MRFKFSLQVLSEVSGDTLPISYQFELSEFFSQTLRKDADAFNEWLSSNHLLHLASAPSLPCVISNLYIPKIMVQGDRLRICVPRIQFWVSFLPEIGTRKLLESTFLDREFSLGDELSTVHFRVLAIEDITPVFFKYAMEYQTLSPLVVKAYRSNHTLEFLNPNNPVFSEFMVDELIERWEHYYQQPYLGNRSFRFTPLVRERRKAVSVMSNQPSPQKIVGYMLKFRLEMDPELQEFAYVSGLGDDINLGFGYVELIRKHK